MLSLEQILNKIIKNKVSNYMPKTSTTPNEALVIVAGLRVQGQKMITKEWKELADNNKWLIISPTFSYEGDNAFKEQKSYQ